MADVAASAVTVVHQHHTAGPNGRARVRKVVRLAGTFTAGTTANKIKASIMQLTKIEEVSMGVLDDNSKIYNLCPSADGTMILVQDVVNAADANKDNPRDITVTSPRVLIFTVVGY